PADTILRMHTNFKLSSSGDSVFLFSPTQQLLSSLYVNVDHPDISIGCFPDTSNNIVLFLHGTPESTNNSSQQYSSYLNPPTISVPSGIYNTLISVSLTNPNSASSEIRYTLNGDDPDSSSALYTGSPIQIFYSNVLKARAFSPTELPSTTSTATYLFGVTHSTPILSVVTDSKNLYGNNGIFTNWEFDWQKAAYAEYFDTLNNLVFSQRAGMQIDGGAGGSRSHPQHSFRLEFDNSILGDGTINYPLIPNRPARDKYSRIYLRNGSNYYLSLPYKDASHEQGMGKETNNYFSAWRPVTVYLNGQYFGLYELREKWDAEYFEELENANPDSMDLLSLSFWNGSTLRAIEGSVDSFLVAYNIFKVLNTANPNFLTFANKYVDMNYYTDYIIGETWVGNTDWPNNNIKIYRSNTTGFRWRFCLIDLEGAMNPNGFSDASHDHINDLINADPNNPYINIFLHSVKNSIYKNYFINRYADVMNTAYQYSKLSANANAMFNQTVIEMPKEYARWGDPNNINGQMTDFVNNHQTLLSELNIRTANVRDFIQNNFSLASQVNVTLDVLPAGAGKIKISTIIPDSLPWTGVYFNGNPVKFTAIANPGYEFDHWDTNAVLSAIDTNIAITKNVSASTTFRAVFNYTGNAGRIAISEVNYNSDSTRNSGNWIEFHNYGNAPVDLSGWRFTDSSASNNFYFPQGTILQDGQYLVLVDDTTKFHSQFPLINVFGPTGFGFNNTTEALTLIDNNNLPVISMRYIDSLPWPKLADGYGMTLELKNDSLDPALASSWFAGCIGGSPGGPYVPCSEDIIFSEVNYNSSLATDAGDWVELYNKTNSAIDVSGWVFSDGDNLHLYELPINSIVPALGRIVLTQDTALFKSRFPMFNGSYGPFGFGLSSNGEAIRLFDQSGSLYQTMMYDDAAPWPNGANGNGYTLELVDYNGNLSEGSNWTDGCPEGSPGTALITPCGTVSVNNPDAPKENVIVYPNPSTGIFNVQIKDVKNGTTKAYAEVYNYLGEKIVSDIQINKHDIIQINLNGYARGMYVLRVVIGEEAVQRVMVVE
ncbi:MAG TPA: lamin tail domain-containing protein, partial [Bacteroidia bacterium]|nr:lamin tail domain-containing protein [Bacteroidia bacterium]